MAKLPSNSTFGPEGAHADTLPTPGAASAEPSEARRLGAYVCGSTLGVGGMGYVVRAKDEELQRDVALKRLHPQLATTADRARFVNEALVTAALSHPGVVPVFHLGTDDEGNPYFTMAEVQGKTLAEALSDGLPPGQRIESFLRVCETVAYAHSRGVLHRDLKPENIMLGAFGQTLVMDWGIARHRADVAESGAPVPMTSPGTRLGAVMGTPGYMSPEQAAGHWDRVDARADVWALGAILAAAWNGTPGGSGRKEALQTLPPPLASVVRRATTTDPAARYPDALAIAADVRRWRDGELVGAHRYGRGELLRRQLTRHGGKVAGVAVALASVAIVTGISLVAVGEARDRALNAEAQIRDTWVKALEEGAFRAWTDRTPADAAVLATEAAANDDDPALRGLIIAARAMATPRLLGSLPLDERCGELALAPGGDTIACAGSAGGNGQTRLFSIDPFAEQVRVPGRWPIAWSPDGRWFAASTKGGYTRFDTTGKVLEQNNVCDAVPTALFAEADTFWVGCSDGLYAVRSGVTTRVDASLKSLNTIVRLPEGLLLVGPNDARFSSGLAAPAYAGVSGLTVGGPWRLERARGIGSAVGRAWNDLGGVTELHGHTAEINAATLVGSVAYTGSADGSVRRWRLPRGPAAERFVLHDGGVSAIEALPGERIAVATRTARGDRVEQGTLSLWSVTSGPTTTADDDVVYAVSRCGGTTFAGGKSGVLWELGGGESWTVGAPVVDLACVAGALLVGATDGLHRFDGHRLGPAEAEGNNGIVSYAEAAGVRALTDLDAYLWINGRRWETPHQQWTSLDPGGRWIATFGEEGGLTILDPNGAILARPECPSVTPGLPAVSPDGRWLLAGFKDGDVRVWDTTSWSLTRELPATEWAREVGVSPDGRRIAAGFNDGTVRVWDLDDGALRASLPSLGGRLRRVEWSDSHTLLAAVDERVYTLSIATVDQPVSQLQGEHLNRWGLSLVDGVIRGGAPR